MVSTLFSIVLFCLVGLSQSSSAPNNATQPVYYYAKARTDQSGRQLVRFFKIDALARSRGGVIGGACPDYHPFKALSPEDIHQHVEETKELLSYMGLQDMFRFKCPTKEDLDSGKAVMMSTKEMKIDVRTIFTPEWLDSLRSRVAFPYKERPDEKYRVAVHVRRGDVTPCGKKAVVARYLPNTFYLKMLDEYLPHHCGQNVTQNCQVTIYSQSKTFESFNPFLERGYHLDLDSDLGKVWSDMINAEVLVLSESAFSYVPAFLNRFAVIQPQYELRALPGWVVIPYYSGLMEAARLETQKLSAQYCGKE